MIKFFRSNLLVSIFTALPVIAIVLWISAFFEPPIITTNYSMPLFDFINKYIGQISFLQTFVALVGTYLQGLLLNRIVNRDQLLNQRSKLVALLFVVLMSCLQPLLSLHPVLFVNLFLILALHRIGSMYLQQNIFSQAFDAGIFIGLASLFYLPSIIFFPFILTSILIIRPFNWREHLIALLGLCVPFAFIYTYFFYFDGLNYFWNEKILHPIHQQTQHISNFKSLDYFLVFSLLILLILSIMKIANTLNNSIVKTQSLLLSLLSFFGFAVLTVVLVGTSSIYAYTFLAIPFSIFLANYFLTMKENWLAEIIFGALLIFILYQHFF